MSDSTVWVEVKREGLWKPSQVGETLEGRYGGTHVANGPSGPFDVVEVRDDRGRIYGVSGVQAISLVRSAGLRDGERIRLVYGGEEPAPMGRSAMRKYKLFVGVRVREAAVWGGGASPTQEVEPPPVDPADPGPTPPPTDAFGRNAIEPDID